MILLVRLSFHVREDHFQWMGADRTMNSQEKGPVS